ncbi:MAG: hypothetical protein XD85_0145 [Parcubacteria bacterium 34_609]|nr:MAG: hypothetical protein XD85_0145 [Parcubacteria bacterium 34_609]KUK99415.1 MAG: hypothetical protein XE08_0008 [Parcubacteria bacterium 32_520]MDK2949020.1 hypothetical protein [Patescibacteria group bacterium]
MKKENNQNAGSFDQLNFDCFPFKTGGPSRIKDVINGGYKEHRARLFYFT